MKQAHKGSKSKEYEGAIRNAAGDYLQRGWSVIKLKPRSKKPALSTHDASTITSDNVDTLVEGDNLGVRFTESGDLKDLDLDYQTASDLAKAVGLPDMTASFGRPSVGIGHCLYNAPGTTAKEFELPEGAYPKPLPLHDGKPSLLVLEIRGADNTYTMFPPSVHPDTGETLNWIEPRRELLDVTAKELRLLAGQHAVASAVLYFYPESASARFDIRMALTGALIRSGMPADLVAVYVQQVARLAGDPKWDEDFAERTEQRLEDDKKVTGIPKLVQTLQLPTACEDVFREWLATNADNGLPEIRIIPGELSNIATLAEQALLEAGLPIYQRCGSLVRPIIEEVDAAHGRRTKIAQLEAIDPVYGRDLLGRVANWLRYNARAEDWAPADPPPAIAATVLARVGEWSFPIIAGVISTPTMRPDGSLLTEPGYDTATRLLLVEPPPMPPIPDAPTLEDALAALALLEDLLEEFPFVDYVARAVALSALITPVVRGAFPVAPMHVGRAPVAGSGKSFLFDTVAAIAIGQPMPVMAAGRNEEETEKRLGAALLAGQPLISIDNVNGELSGDALCQIIERPIVDIRILGKSERVRIETRATTMFSTGNNITLVGDLCRRAITATLDPRLERPELRQFKGSPVEKVLGNRGAYIAACLTICRAYIVAGRPNKAPKLASFEDWSDTVRSALIWLGKADPVASMETARAEDPDLSALRDFLSVWVEAIGLGYEPRLTMADVIELINKKTINDQPLHPKLHAAVQAVAGRQGPPDAQKLGVWARGKKDRVVGDLRLANEPDPKGSAKWWVQHTDDKREQAPKSASAPEQTGGDATNTNAPHQSAPGWSETV